MKLRLAALSGALAAVTAVAVAGPAAALENPADLTRITVPAGVTIASTACRNIPVTYSVAADPGWEFWGAQVELRANGVLQSTEFVTSAGGLEPYFYCPYFDKLGRYTFGPSVVSAWDNTTSTGPNFADTTQTSTFVKLGARASLSASRSGARVTFTASTARFDVPQAAWIRWRAPRVTLQGQRADGTWLSLGPMTYTSAGVAKKTVTAASAATYRVVADGNSTVWTSSSSRVRR